MKIIAEFFMKHTFGIFIHSSCYVRPQTALHYGNYILVVHVSLSEHGPNKKIRIHLSRTLSSPRKIDFLIGNYYYLTNAVKEITKVVTNIGLKKVAPDF